MMRRGFQASLMVIVAASAACGSKKQPADDTPARSDGNAAAGPSTDGAPKRTAVSAQKLSPVIHELGVDKVVPTAIVIELASAIVDTQQVGQVSEKSRLVLKPEAAGTLTYSKVAELTFTPTAPLAFDTTYQVELDKIETRDGVLEPIGGAKWTYSFKTPSFKFLGWAPTEIDVTKHKLAMAITFSGAVLPNIARAAMTFALDGHPIAGVGVLPSHTPNTVVVEVTDPRLALGSKLSLAIKQGLPSLAAEAKAPAAAVAEGGNGFYVEVICDDKAAAAGNRAYYEDEGYYNLSQRCQLSDDAISHVHFDPPVKKPYITSGRAGFRVFGDFKRGVYSIKIDAGATSVDGGVLLSAFARSFSVSARKPQLSFMASGRYLPRNAWTNLGIKHLNVDAVNLTVRQVPPENLVFWLGNDADAPDERTVTGDDQGRARAQARRRWLERDVAVVADEPVPRREEDVDTG